MCYSLSARLSACLALVVASAMPLTTLATICGNQNNTPNCPDNQCPSACSGPNPFNPFTGIVVREVSDLALNTKLGDSVLAFRRMGFSRNLGVPGSLTTFGGAHYWRHSWHWQMTDSGADASGQPRVTLTTPEGWAQVFTLVDGLWKPPAGIGNTLAQAGDQWTYQTPEGVRIGFKRMVTSSGAPYYRFAARTDSLGVATTASYDTAGRISRLTDAAGRWIELGYATVPLSARSEALKYTVPTPDAGGWSEILLPAGTTARFLRYEGSLDTYCRVAEFEAYAPDGTPLTGNLTASLPAAAGHAASAARDGDAATYYQFTGGSFGSLALDFGAVIPVARLRLRAAPAPAPAGSLKGSVYLGDLKPLSLTVLANITAHDGRAVHYDYTLQTDALVGGQTVALTGVDYPDGASAVYTYAQPIAGQRFLLETADDPRFAGLARRVRYAFKTDNIVYGQLWRELDPVTGTVLAEIGEASRTQPTVTLGHGATTTYTFPDGGFGRFNRAVDALGRTTTHTYSQGATGFHAATTDPLGRTTSYTRDALGRPTRVTHPDGTYAETTYDAAGRVLATTDELGRTTVHARDPLGRITRTEFADGTSETFTYNAFAQLLAHTARDGTSSTRAYDVLGRLVAFTDAAGEITAYAYDDSDRVIGLTDPLGRGTGYEHDAADRIIAVIHPDATSSAYDYSPYGDLLVAINELGHETRFGYDGYGRRTSTTDPLGRSTLVNFGLPGAAGGCGCANTSQHPTTQTTASGMVTRLVYDLAWQVIARTEAADTAEAATTTYVYDQAGRLLTETDPLGRATTHLYDTRGRRIRSTDPLGRATQFGYDAVGNLTSTTRADGQATSHLYDSVHRRIRTTDALGQATQFAYDAVGRLTRLTDPRGAVTQWSYDVRGLLRRKTYADATYEENTYDIARQRTLHRTPAGVTRACTYDLRGRELTCDWSDATPDVTRAYDDASRLVTLVTQGVATHTYAYDAAGQLLSEVTAPAALAPVTFTVGYLYDADGRRSQLSYPDGGVVATAYSARSQISAVSADGPPPLATFTYDLAGRRTGKALENGTTTAYIYDVADQLTALVHRDPGSVELARFAYGYDTGGRRTAKTITGTGAIARAEAYGYDAIDQVTSSNYGAAGAESFAYDAMGNRISANLLGVGTVNYTANALNQYTTIGAATPTYDVNGNTLTLPGRTFTYDGQSRMKSATVDLFGLPGYHAASFVYDARNRQVSRTVDGITTYFIWDGWSLLAEYQVTGGTPTQVARYVHGPRLDEILVQARGTTPTPLYFHHDSLGSTYLTTNAAGAVVERYTYTAFGQVSAFDNTGATVATPATRFLYTGREWLGEIGLNDHRNRFYMPSIGRWPSRDPIGESDGPNLYAYVKNESISFIDLRGLNRCCTSQQAALDAATSTLNTTRVDYQNSLRSAMDAERAYSAGVQAWDLAFEAMVAACAPPWVSIRDPLACNAARRAAMALANQLPLLDAARSAADAAVATAQAAIPVAQADVTTKQWDLDMCLIRNAMATTTNCPCQ